MVRGVRNAILYINLANQFEALRPSPKALGARGGTKRERPPSKMGDCRPVCDTCMIMRVRGVDTRSLFFERFRSETGRMAPARVL
jgi:hypothetical protein